MAFLTDSTVIHIKLTESGREKLSRGELTFKKFALGDSEIDYQFNSDINFLTENNAIYRPVDNNPNIISFIRKNELSENILDLPSVPNITNIITNTPEDRGFFNVTSGSTSIINDIIHTKQPNISIAISSVNGGKELALNQTDDYGSITTEPEIGDYIMIRWVNPLSTGDTLTFSVDKVYPYLFYKIEDIISGSLSNNDLVIEVDRELPNFNGNGGVLQALGIVYPNNNNREVIGDAVQNYYGAALQTDFIEDSVISFIENYTTPTLDVPIWNLSIVFTEEIVGVINSDRNYSQYFTKNYGGFVSYIQEQTPIFRKLGLIHYTNQSPSNNYGEGLYNDTPKLFLPHIMWHKKSKSTIGIELSADSGNKKTLTNLKLDYYDLIDSDDNVVGKVFNDMKLFVIEDQELLFAMSYKSNRSWTLPEHIIEFNLTKCAPELTTTTTTTTLPPTTSTTTSSTTTTTTTTSTTTTTTTLPPCDDCPPLSSYRENDSSGIKTTSENKIVFSLNFNGQYQICDNYLITINGVEYDYGWAIIGNITGISIDYTGDINLAQYNIEAGGGSPNCDLITETILQSELVINN